MNKFGTFWKGPRLSGFEASCLHSFVSAGHEVTLFSFDPVDGIPAGVRHLDARNITDPSGLERFVIDGKASISHFSDYFRYLMFAKTDLTWIDTDVFLLRGWPFDPDRNLLALETAGSICNAVMRLSSREPMLHALIQRAEALMDRQMRHGETGPRLITTLAGGRTFTLQAHDPALYFPIHFDEFWKVFLPEHAAECGALCQRAHTLHLWNNIVDRLGFWKDFLPPEGSFLNRLLAEGGNEQFFKGTFPLRNMRQLIENWQSRQTGQHLGIRNVVRQVLPSIVRTYRHHAG